MRRLLALVLIACPFAAAAQDAPEPPVPELDRRLPPVFICAVSRETPLGTIGAQQAISPSGVPDGEPLFSWSTPLGTGGINLNASWRASPGNYSFVQLSYANANPQRTYRFRVEGTLPEGQNELQLDSGPTRPHDGTVHIFSRWGTLTAAIAEAYDPHIVLIDDEGTIVGSELVDPAIFGRARDIATRLRPELAPLVANYRNLCTYYTYGPNGEISFPIH
jgi:hypothetical protein